MLFAFVKTTASTVSPALSFSPYSLNSKIQQQREQVGVWNHSCMIPSFIITS